MGFLDGLSGLASSTWNAVKDVGDVAGLDGSFGFDNAFTSGTGTSGSGIFGDSNWSTDWGSMFGGGSTGVSGSATGNGNSGNGSSGGLASSFLSAVPQLYSAYVNNQSSDTQNDLASKYYDLAVSQQAATEADKTAMEDNISGGLASSAYGSNGLTAEEIAKRKAATEAAQAAALAKA